MHRKVGPRTIDALIGAAHWEFKWALDYVWKAPTLIEQLTKIEEEKLKYYTGKLRSYRWFNDIKPLRDAFPVLLSHGNLFAVSSLFEMYVLQLATLAQQSSRPRLDETKGYGVGRSLAYLRRIGVGTNGIALWPQVDAALKVRNCLVHARGILLYSREALELRRIVKNRTFLRLEHRGATASKVVRITKSGLGDRVAITNEYSWLACAYLRDYFMGLCEESRKALFEPLLSPPARRVV